MAARAAQCGQLASGAVRSAGRRAPRLRAERRMASRRGTDEPARPLARPPAVVRRRARRPVPPHCAGRRRHGGRRRPVPGARRLLRLVGSRQHAGGHGGDHRRLRRGRLARVRATPDAAAPRRALGCSGPGHDLGGLAPARAGVRRVGA